MLTWGPPAAQVKESGWAEAFCGCQLPLLPTLKQLGWQSNQESYVCDPVRSFPDGRSMNIYYEGPIRKGNGYSKQAAGRVD